MATPFGGLPRIDLRQSTPEALAAWQRHCTRDVGLSGEADATAREIIAAVRQRGDAALIEFTQRFEGRQLTVNTLEVPTSRRTQAHARLDPAVRDALELAARRIMAFHRTQTFKSSGHQGESYSMRSRAAPLRRVAVYAPGGSAAYPSSVLMTAIPAKVAGVPEVILLTPRANDAVLVAADLAGVDRIFEVGGAQAIAAAALGTATIPRVDKIVGPGNAFVTAAKRRVFGLCDIDGIAGPSEILIAADRDASPHIVAADLLSQAEHDRQACAVLVTDDLALLEAVDVALADALKDLPRANIAADALQAHGAGVLAPSRAKVIELANAYAPEHLELLVAGAQAVAAAITRAGAIFVGPWTPEAAGDYTAGPSHVLPTAGAARFGSPLGVWDFVKYTSVVQFDEATLRGQADAIMAIARAEGLEGHARAVEARLQLPDTPGTRT